MARISGILDNVIVEQGGSDITQDLGHIVGAGFSIDNKTKAYASINGGADYVELIDDVADIRASLTVNPTSLQALKLIGTVNVATGWTWEWDDTLPYNTMQGKVYGSDFLKIDDIKFGDATIRLNEGEPLEITFDGIAKSTTVNNPSSIPTPPSTSRINYLDVYLDDGAGNEYGKIKTFTITLSRSLEARRGVEKTTSGEKRKITDIVEKLKDIKFSGTVEITNENVFNDVFGNTAWTPEDTRTNRILKLDCGDAGYITLTGRVSKLNHIKRADGSIMAVDFEGIGLSITAGGS